MPTNAWSNDSISTLVIPTGATTGARVVIDGTTGLISVYNSSNQLVGQWGGNSGCFFEYAGGVGSFVEICGGEIQFGSTGFTPASNPTIIENGITAFGTSVIIDSGNSGGVNSSSNLELFGGTGPAGAEIRATQRGFNGDVVQLDVSNNAGQLMHAGSYSGTVAGGDGHWIFAHGCAFTPTVAVLTPYAAGGGDGPGYVRMWTTPTDGTFCYTIWTSDGGGRTPNGTTVGVNAIFLG